MSPLALARNFCHCCLPLRTIAHVIKHVSGVLVGKGDQYFEKLYTPGSHEGSSVIRMKRTVMWTSFVK